LSESLERRKKRSEQFFRLVIQSLYWLHKFCNKKRKRELQGKDKSQRRRRRKILRRERMRQNQLKKCQLNVRRIKKKCDSFFQEFGQNLDMS